MHYCWCIAILNSFYSGSCMKRCNYFKVMLKRVILARIEWKNVKLWKSEIYQICSWKNSLIGTGVWCDLKQQNARPIFQKARTCFNCAKIKVKNHENVLSGINPTSQPGTWKKSLQTQRVSFQIWSPISNLSSRPKNVKKQILISDIKWSAS